MHSKQGPAAVYTESFGHLSNASSPQGCHARLAQTPCLHVSSGCRPLFCLPSLPSLNLNLQHDGIKRWGSWEPTRRTWGRTWGHEDASWWDRARPLIRRGKCLRRPFQAPESGKGTLLLFPAEGLLAFICPSKFSSRFLRCLKHALVSFSP